MKFTSFLFICGWYLALTFFGNPEWLVVEVQLIVAAVLILSVGIPHGAIDHIIFLEDHKTTPGFQFYLFYFSLMGGYIITWLLLPFYSFIFFLLLSAFHFGQSQFSDIEGIPKTSSLLLYTLWGVSILSGLMFYHHEELGSFFTSTSDLESLAWAFDKQLHTFLLPFSTLASVVILVFSTWKKQISTSRFFMEILLLTLIHLSFFTLPFIVGFTLYFAMLHSMRVLVEEYEYLTEKGKVFSIQGFLKLLFPYSFISAVGAVLLLVASYWNWITISNTLLGLILISIVTLPHSIVMNNFYTTNSKKHNLRQEIG